MANKTVVRNTAYHTSGFNTRERHNERKNESYFNGDIELDRAYLNVHFKQNFHANGEAETYEETFNRLLKEKTIVKHGTQPNAKLFCEMVFDVNTTYFEDNGGYEYAKKFFEEAYRLAVKEAGNEAYIISAVMHADERNKEVSEQLGRDIYHYHLHVVYVPIVEKKLYFNKSNKNPELAGKFKEIIPQISQSNKWPMRMQGERDGKIVTLNSYSFLQDRYFEHMRDAGFVGFQRGERGSTAEHLDVLDFKIKKDKARAEAMEVSADLKEKEVATMDKKVEHKVNQIIALDKKIEDYNFAEAYVKEIKKFGKNKNLFGQIIVTPEDLEYVKAFAHEGATSRVKISELKSKVENIEKDRNLWKNRHEGLVKKVSLFLDATKRAPHKVTEFLTDIMRQPPEQDEPQINITKTKSREVGR